MMGYRLDVRNLFFFCCLILWGAKAFSATSGSVNDPVTHSLAPVSDSMSSSLETGGNLNDFWSAFENMRRQTMEAGVLPWGREGDALHFLENMRRQAALKIEAQKIYSRKALSPLWTCLWFLTPLEEFRVLTALNAHEHGFGMPTERTDHTAINKLMVSANDFVKVRSLLVDQSVREGINNPEDLFSDTVARLHSILGMPDENPEVILLKKHILFLLFYSMFREGMNEETDVWMKKVEPEILSLLESFKIRIHAAPVMLFLKKVPDELTRLVDALEGEPRKAFGLNALLSSVGSAYLFLAEYQDKHPVSPGDDTGYRVVSIRETQGNSSAERVTVSSAYVEGGLESEGEAQLRELSAELSEGIKEFEFGRQQLERDRTGTGMKPAKAAQKEKDLLYGAVQYPFFMALTKVLFSNLALDEKEQNSLEKNAFDQFLNLKEDQKKQVLMKLFEKREWGLLSSFMEQMLLGLSQANSRCYSALGASDELIQSRDFLELWVRIRQENPSGSESFYIAVERKLQNWMERNSPQGEGEPAVFLARACLRSWAALSKTGSPFVPEIVPAPGVTFSA